MSKPDLKDTRRRLDRVSPCFCPAKWLQVSLHLQNGHTHSCHHPQTHLVPLSELRQNPGALHNTEFKKQQRRRMLQGERPEECAYCWKIEDLPSAQVSDRLIKAHDDWAQPRIEELAGLPWHADVTPSYLEVGFSNTCNFKCVYCGPNFSSAWMAEIVRHGPYPNQMHSFEHMMARQKFPLPDEAHNPYIEAFWKWWPEVYPRLHTFRITGGEPLLSEQTFNVLDYILAHPHPGLNLAINTNLGVPTALVERLARSLTEISAAGAVRQIQIFASLDSWGKQAEYIRTGLELDLFERNLATLSRVIPELEIILMCTYNVFSVVGFRALLQNLLRLRTEGGTGNIRRLRLDVSYLRDPDFLSVFILPRRYAAIAVEDLEFMRARSEAALDGGFSRHEIDKFARIVAAMESSPVTEASAGSPRRRLLDFIEALDFRRRTEFWAVFPEMQDLLEL